MGSRVLLIEDNLANLELMTYLLEAFGFTVLTAEDGHRGLEVARQQLPDLIICDIQIPELDGYEVARWLKSSPELKWIPLVAVTALAMVGDRDRVLAAGFDAYVAKPINPELFVRQMETYLKKSGPSHPATHPMAPEHTPTGPGQGPTILVVDNRHINLELARGILEPSGYRVRTAMSMTSGLELARQEHCDLILSDVCMGEGSGFDFMLAVRADPNLKDIPFLLITSTMVTEKDRARGLALGATRFLVRPLEPEAFLAEIRGSLIRKEDVRGDHPDRR